MAAGTAPATTWPLRPVAPPAWSPCRARPSEDQGPARDRLGRVQDDRGPSMVLVGSIRPQAQIAGLNTGTTSRPQRRPDPGPRLHLLLPPCGELIAADCINRPRDFMFSKRVITQQSPSNGPNWCSPAAWTEVPRCVGGGNDDGGCDVSWRGTSVTIAIQPAGKGTLAAARRSPWRSASGP